MEPSQYCELLGWPKSSFRFFHKMLWKNSNGLYGQPNIKMCWLPWGVLDFLSFLTLLFFFFFIFFKIQELKCVGHVSMSLFALFALYLGQGRVEVLFVWLLLFFLIFPKSLVQCCAQLVHSSGWRNTDGAMFHKHRGSRDNGTQLRLCPGPWSHWQNHVLDSSSVSVDMAMPVPIAYKQWFNQQLPFLGRRLALCKHFFFRTGS